MMAASFLTQTQLCITDLDEVLELLKSSHFLERNWLNLGLKLGLLKHTLDTVEVQYGTDVGRRLLECLSLWLRREDKVDEKGGPTWDSLATALSQIGEKISADSVRQKEFLHKCLKALSECMINPVKMSQLLFSERCISEATLDEVETLEGTLDVKKTFLLSAIHKAVSSEHKKLKLLATVLSKFDESKHLADKINNEYSQKFPDDQTTSVNIQEVTITAHSDQISHEDCASDILRRYYGTLTESLKYPITVAQQLQGEGIISEEILTFVKSAAWSSSERKATFILLKAVRHAVHTKYRNLEIFASVLLKFTNNVQCAKTANDILKDCEKLLPPNDDISDEQPTEDESLKNVPLPRSLSSVFGSFRKKFAISFNKIREVINASPPPLDKLKLFLEDGYSHLRPELDHSNTINEVLTVVRNHCTLINISCLEAIVERFDIKEAETHLQTYRDDVKNSCIKMKASLCLNENLKVTRTPSLLQCETAVFVLKWDPVDCTLEDIEEILSESLGRNVEIRKVAKGNSIIVTCFFPVTLATLLIARAQETLELMKKKGLIKFTIGYCTVYDNRRDEEITSLHQTLDSNQEKLHQLEHQIQNEKEKNHQLEVRLSQKESQLQQQPQSRKSDSSSWEQYIDEMEKEMERVQGELKALRDKNQDFQTENHHLMTKKNRAVEEQDRLKKKLEQKQDNCQEYLEEAQMWKEQFESAQRDLELERKAREKEAQDVQALQYSLQREVDELRRRVTQCFDSFIGTSGAITEPLGDHRTNDPYLLIPIPRREQSPDHYIPQVRPSGIRHDSGIMSRPNTTELYVHDMKEPSHSDDQRESYNQPIIVDQGFIPQPYHSEEHHPMKQPVPLQQPIQGGVVLPGEIPNLAKPSITRPTGDRHSGEQNYPLGHVEGSRHPIEKESPPTLHREQGPGYGSDVYNPPALPLGEQGYRHPMQQGSPPMPREHGPGRGNIGYNQTDRPIGDQDYHPLPQEGFPPRQTGGGDWTAPVAGIGQFQRSECASLGGEILGQHFQQRPRQILTAQEYRHQVTPKYENIHPGQPYGRNQFPPPDPQSWQQHNQGGVVLPGDLPNLAKPSMTCPLCGRADFATQMELEMHCAKCD